MKLTKFEIGLLAAFLLVTAAGVGGYFYTASLVQSQVDASGAARDELAKAVKRGYLPTKANAATLTQNNATNRQAKETIEAQLDGGKKLLAQVTAKNPVLFKQDLAEKVRLAVEAARQHNVGLPGNFYLTFSRFKLENPEESSTVVLGKQLLATGEIVSVLTAAEVIKIEDLRRSFEEDLNGRGGRAPGAGSEELAARAITRPYYTVYPFQTDFIGTTDILRRVLEGLSRSPLLFVVRSVQVTNSKPVAPRLDDLENAAATGAAGSGPRAPKIVLGDEQIRVRLRIDLIEWGKSEAVPARNPGGRSK